MIIKKFKGKPYGVEFSAAERKALDLELRRETAESDRRYKEDIDAMFLYAMMMGYGWKRRRLRKCWNIFSKVHRELCEYYLMNEPGDNEWLAHRKLKEIGVDVREWYKEDEQNDKTVL